ncbi:hypothetical protein C0J52_14911 [Blattella germanica]|nr:hypothetical protein C0J52_14911 [Blattella germanica]
MGRICIAGAFVLLLVYNVWAQNLAGITCEDIYCPDGFECYMKNFTCWIEGCKPEPRCRTISTTEPVPPTATPYRSTPSTTESTLAPVTRGTNHSVFSQKNSSSPAKLQTN